MRRLLVLLIVVAAGMAAVAYHWANQPLAFASAGSVDLSIEPGTSARAVAQQVKEAGIDINPTLLFWCIRVSGQARLIKAGSYELDPGLTPLTLLQKLVRGEEALRSVTIVEGWTFRQMRDALAKADNLKPDSQGMSDDNLMAALGAARQAAEGRFFPDTYTYAKGSSDIAVYQRAYRAMNKRLAAAWDLRAPDTPLQSADELLNLASIVEKETGRASDRAMVAGVFTNRLRITMPLQTDPTVIYGLGERFDGNLRKRDLQTDTPYNTYTRLGLPPTPIALPGKASLLAAAQPAATKALYFVARGDGTSQFSATLEEHNRAVNKYQRGQP